MKADSAFDLLKNRIDSVIVAGLSSHLTLMNVQLKPEIRVTALKTFDLPSDKKEETAFNSLAAFVQDNNIQHKNILLNLASVALYIKRIQLPSMPDSEMLEAIKWQIKPEVPFDLERAVMDFIIVKEIAKEDGTRVSDVICIAAPEQDIKAQVSLFKRAGFNCLSVVPLLFGYTKLAAKYFLRNSNETLGVLHIGEEKSSISFHKDGNLEFYRDLPISINKLREVLGGTIISDKGKIQLGSQETDEILFKYGIPVEDSFMYKDKMSGQQILAMLRPILERLKGEVERSLTYYTSQLRGSVVSSILLSGFALRMPNIDKFLNKELSLNIQEISFADKIKIDPGVDTNALAENAALFGLSLDFTHGINLLPREFRLEKLEQLQKKTLTWVGFIVFLLLFFPFIFNMIRTGIYQARLSASSQHLGILAEVKSMKDTSEVVDRFISDTRGAEPYLGKMLEKISNVAPRDLFIENISFNCDSKTANIKGFIRDTGDNQGAILTKFSGELEASSYFSDVSIVSVEKNKVGEATFARFNVNAKLQ